MDVAGLGLAPQKSLTWTYSSRCCFFGPAPSKSTPSYLLQLRSLACAKEVADLGLLPRRALPCTCSGRGGWLRPVPQRSLTQGCSLIPVPAEVTDSDLLWQRTLALGLFPWMLLAQASFCKGCWLGSCPWDVPGSGLLQLRLMAQYCSRGRHWLGPACSSSDH